MWQDAVRESEPHAHADAKCPSGKEEAGGRRARKENIGEQVQMIFAGVGGWGGGQQIKRERSMEERKRGRRGIKGRESQKQKRSQSTQSPTTRGKREKRRKERETKTSHNCR